MLPIVHSHLLSRHWDAPPSLEIQKEMKRLNEKKIQEEEEIERARILAEEEEAATKKGKKQKKPKKKKEKKKKKIKVDLTAVRLQWIEAAYNISLDNLQTRGGYNGAEMSVLAIRVLRNLVQHHHTTCRRMGNQGGTKLLFIIFLFYFFHAFTIACTFCVDAQLTFSFLLLSLSLVCFHTLSPSISRFVAITCRHVRCCNRRRYQYTSRLFIVTFTRESILPSRNFMLQPIVGALDVRRLTSSTRSCGGDGGAVYGVMPHGQ